MRRAVFVASGVFACTVLPCLRAQTGPAIAGFVTSAGTLQYKVNAVEVVCDPALTQERVQANGRMSATQSCPARILGENITVFGTEDKKTHVVHATAVETDKPSDLAVDGFALVDRILAPVSSGAGTLRADGLPLTITPSTKITFAQNSGLTVSRIGTNVWVRYTGTLHPDGSVTAASLLFSPNLIAPAEVKLRTRSDFDAAAVREEDRQGSVSRFFFGANGKRIPASHDTAAQQRLVALGNRLIPAYQRDLPASDPTKIDFRFQLVDEPKVHSTLAAPSGVIQVPEQFEKKLPDDSEFAAVIAATIAEVLEKQSLRAVPGNNARTAANAAGAVAGIFLPGAGLATQLVTGTNARSAERHRQQQIARTSLSFLQDAGFDLASAPVAWWKLADTKGKGLEHTKPPFLTETLYTVLSTAYVHRTR